VINLILLSVSLFPIPYSLFWASLPFAGFDTLIKLAAWWTVLILKNETKVMQIAAINQEHEFFV
jgi:hypothetical protein